jgi:hypothetical protein
MRSFLLIATFGVISTFAVIGQATAKQNAELAVRERGHSLYLVDGPTSLLVKRLSGDNEIQGYKLLDKSSAFVAYSYFNSGPGTILSIITFKPHSEHIVGNLGGTADIEFAFNPLSKSVVFNWNGGLYIFNLDKLESIPDNNDKYRAFESSLVRVYSCAFYCYSPKWIDSTTLSVIDQNREGPDKTKIISVPK